VLYDASGRRLRRCIGFLPEYRVVREEKPTVDLVSDHEIEIDDDDETEDE
jgi:hypothetical protein